MDANATATLVDGSRVRGRLTTNHAASSYGQPVFVDDAGIAYNWASISDISTAAELGKTGGSATSQRKAEAARQNGRKGGRPRKDAQKGSTS